MYYKLVSKLDVECLELSYDEMMKKDLEKHLSFAFKEVVESIKEMILLLSEYDNAHEERSSEKDLGGYVVLFTEEVDQDNICYQKLMERYYLKPEYMEYEDIIFEINGKEGSTTIEWVRQVFILSCDYALTLVFPRKNTRSIN